MHTCASTHSYFTDVSRMCTHAHMYIHTSYIHISSYIRSLNHMICGCVHVTCSRVFTLCVLRVVPRECCMYAHISSYTYTYTCPFQICSGTKYDPKSASRMRDSLARCPKYIYPHTYTYTYTCCVQVQVQVACTYAQV